MTDTKKIIVCTGRNGSKLSINPNNIVSAMPDEKIIGETVVVLSLGASSGQLFVKMPHDQFARVWEAALNGKDGLLN